MSSTTNTVNSLEQYKTEQEKMLQQQKRQAEADAYTNYQKRRKYLPQRTAGQSLGMTETAKIAANNSYRQNVAAADTVYSKGMSDLNNYVRTEKKAEQDEAYNMALNMMEGQYWNTTDELSTNLNKYKDKVSDTQWADLTDKLSAYKGDKDIQKADAAYGKTATFNATDDAALSGYLSDTNEGNNFKIGKYKVELGGSVDEKVVPASETEDLADETVFAYDGALYIKKDGGIYRVRGRGNKPESDDYKNALKLFLNVKNDESMTTTTVDASSQTPPPKVLGYDGKYYVYSDGSKRTRAEVMGE